MRKKRFSRSAPINIDKPNDKTSEPCAFGGSAAVTVGDSDGKVELSNKPNLPFGVGTCFVFFGDCRSASELQNWRSKRASYRFSRASERVSSASLRKAMKA
jgi:hypothetical protein